MTKTLSLRSGDIFNPSFHKFGIGFDSIFDELERQTSRQSTQTYPPYNIIRKDDNHFSIELAVAGFKEGDIDIQMEKNTLTINGKQVEQETEVDYLVHGISSRTFSRVFTLAEFVVVKNAEIANGMLTISLEREIPEAQQARQISISYSK